jgi:two-component system, OmpR family, phosphate regulon sensor histidine kinase PhoR
MGRDDDELARRTAAVDLVRRRMINVVGHELRTPVSAIRGLADAMLTASDAELRGELVPAVARSAARLERLIDDLLLAAGVTTVLPPAAARAEPVGPALASAWAEVGAPGSLDVRGDTGTDVVVRPRSLGLILTRVIDNAVKYGSPAVTVCIVPLGDRVAVEIGSTSALPDSDLELAFEPFFRGEAAVTTAPGFGIGLPVARALAEHDGGSLVLERRGDAIVARLELNAAGPGHE